MSENFILIKEEKFFYEEIKLFHGRKIINTEISRNNLKILSSILNKEGIKYGLIYGTLLGAIREKGFIAHDEDTDLYILQEDKERLFTLLPILKDNGLELIRVHNDLISIIKNNEYIDIYYAKKPSNILLANKRRILDNFLNKKDIENPVSFKFLGIDTFIPNNSVKMLRNIYGKSWQTPIVYEQNNAVSFLSRVSSRFPILRKCSFLYYMKSKIKRFL